MSKLIASAMRMPPRRPPAAAALPPTGDAVMLGRRRCGAPRAPVLSCRPDACHGAAPAEVVVAHWRDMTAPIFHFDGFRLDPARRELWRADERIDLPPKIFDCIAYLIAHRDRAVGRDELIAAVWGRADVSDNLLDQAMLRARRSLGDTEGERRYIRTMPRFGFRWVADVREEDTSVVEPSTLATATPTAPPAHAGGRTERAVRAPVALAVAALALLAAIAAFAWTRMQDRPPRTPVAALVLPFEVHAEGPSGWIRLGAMDLVAEQLRQGGRLVLPSDNVVALTRDGGPWTRGGPRTAELARNAGASIIVAGEAVLADGRWRVGLRTLFGIDPPVVVEASASDVLVAARAAAASLEGALGWTGGIDAGLPAASELALALRQIDAALLADEAEVARRLLDGLGADRLQLPEVRFRRAAIDLREGDLDAAQVALESLLGSVPATDAPLLRARVLNALGNVQLRRDHPDRVAEFSEQAIALLADLPPSPELGRALTGRAIARSLQQRYDESMEDFSRARIVLEGAGDRLGLARVDINVGILDARRARYAEALPVLVGAADRLTAFRDFNNELFARTSLARVRLELLDSRAALAGDVRLRELVQAEPSPAKRRYANLVRAMVLDATGQLAAARDLLAEVRADAAAADDAVVEAMAAAVDARAALGRGDATRAIADARASLAVDWSGESEIDHARTWRVLLLAQRQAGQGADAEATLASMHNWANGRTDSGVGLQLDLAEAACAEGPSARAAFEQALARADARRVPAELVEVAEAYLPWLLAAGDGARASVLAGRVGGWAEADHAAALLQLRFQHALGNADGWRNALVRARANAGERAIPAGLEQPPDPRG